MFPTQIIVTKELKPEADRELADSVLEMSIQANKQILEELKEVIV